jgi:hypothetical protein
MQLPQEGRMKERHLPESTTESAGLPELERTPTGWRMVGVPEGRGPALDPCKRRDARLYTSAPVSTTFIDPVFDPVAQQNCYQTSDEDTVLNLSRRGAGLRCERPPHVGTRVLIQIQSAEGASPIELIGRTCWTRVEYVPGESGARAVAAVGVEFVGGSGLSFDRFERWLGELGHNTQSIASLPALG